ncbi:uncharacterized protein LOC103729794 isoform X3 [Nannospalax galili]|uniref:uncharacterized protein LOC103729794 isoform X3 n=1 Tax=Nannospalax galili TaxID=1026970 RepID=UPI00111C6E99|nr:uncharacterized protein LOC103729794 isoform X3 [Nannospalax galili]
MGLVPPRTDSLGQKHLETLRLQQVTYREKDPESRWLHTTARCLVTRTHREETRTVCREQAWSLDYWPLQSYYSKRIVGGGEMTKQR